MTEREFMEQDAVLRARWNNEKLSDETRESARIALLALIAAYTKEYPPLILSVGSEDQDEAEKYGF